MNCAFIYRRLRVKPRYGSAFLRPLVSAAVMGAAAWAVYGIAAKLLHVAVAESRLPVLLAMGLAIAAAVVVYVVMVVVTKSVTLEDMKLIPKGEKLARLLHIK